MSDDVDRDEADIRRRAGWLLAMLAVVAGLLVAVFLIFFDGSDKTGNHQADPKFPSYYDTPTSTASGSGPSGGPATGGPSGPSGPSGISGTSGTGASSGPATNASTTDGPPPKASCPSAQTCSVPGDIAGAVTAINKVRAQHGEKPISVTTTSQAKQCALTSGSDCPQSFVWVHVDNLSGSAVVEGVEGFNGSDDLLDASAKSFAIGWAYDPGSGSTSCAVISAS